jgi:hypothetical protein
MGIDNNSRLFFGYILSDEDIVKIFSKISNPGFSQDDLYDGFRDGFEDKFNDEIKNEFPQLFFGLTSPYYDSPSDEQTYYISLFDSRQTKLTLEELTQLMMWDTNTNYRKFFDYFGIEFSPPKMYSLPHIW